MANNKTRDEYVIGILFTNGKIKYVTDIGEGRTAYWKDGKEAIGFSKTRAVDMCIGFAWNGISAVPMLKLDWITYRNPDADNEND